MMNHNSLIISCEQQIGLDVHVHVRVVGSSPTRGSSFFLGKVTALGVLCCFALFVCLTLLASFFHLSFKNMYMYEGIKSRIAQDTFQPMPGLISCAGVTGRGLVSGLTIRYER